MNKLRRRFPNCFTGYEETEHEFSTLEEMLEIDWVKNATQQPDYHQLSVGSENWGDKKSLMIELNDGNTWFVIGWLWLENEIDLPKWEHPKRRKK